MKKSYLIFLLVAGMLINKTYSQTNLIPPSDGGFETGTTFAANGWIPINGVPIVHVWQVGSGQTGFIGARAAFDGDNSTTVGTTNATRAVHFYKSVVIPAGTVGMEFTFAYKQPVTDIFLGVIYDGMEINLQSAAPVVGTRAPAPLFRQGANVYAAFTNLIGTIDATTYAGTTQNLVFTYFSDNISPIGHVGVDNIAVKYTSCTAPSGVSASSITATTGTINWTAPASAPSDYEIFYSTVAGTPSFTTTPTATAIAGTSYNATGLTANTTYYVWVRSNCSGTKSLWTAMPSFLTGCTTPTTKTATISTGSSNWSTLVWIPAGTPTNCDDVIINYTQGAGSPVALISLDANVNINSLTMNGIYSGSGKKTFQLLTVGYNMNIQKDLSLNSTGGTTTFPNYSSVQFLATDFPGIQSKIVVGGNTIIGKTTDTQLSSIGGGIGTTPTFTFKGDVTFNNISSSSSPGTYIFDKPGIQVLTNNTLLYVVIFQNALIGQVNNTVLNVAGTPLGNALFTGVSGGNLTVKAGASLVLPRGSAFSQLGNPAAAQGTFSLGAGALLKLGDSTSRISIAIGNFPGYSNNNFPAHFATTTLSNTSTVEYNSGATIDQTVYAPVTYGNLIITNSTGSGTTIKNLTANITGITGNSTINPFATLDLVTFTANRTAGSGSMTVNANGVLKISGSSGGQAGSNFPLNFTPVTLDPASTVEYYGGTQSIYGGINYGHLTLSGTLAKIAPATTLTINGNLVKTTATTFNHNNGLVLFSGSFSQLYRSALPTMDFYNFTNNNTTGLSIKTNCSITRELLLAANSKLNFDSTGDMTLRSSFSRTAHVAQVPASASISYTGAGRFIAERYIPTGINHGKSWQFLAVPVTGPQSVNASWQENNAPLDSVGGPNNYGTTISSAQPNAVTRGFDFYTPIVGLAGGSSIKTYDVTSSSFKGIDDFAPLSTTSSLALYDQRGYMVFVRGDRRVNTFSGPGSTAVPTTLREKGKIFTASVGELPPNTTVLPNKFASVGNPYASVIDFSKIGLVGVDTIFYVWDPLIAGSNNLGGYQTFNKATGYVPTVPTANYPAANSKIQSGQAFFVHNANAVPGTVSFIEVAKDTGSRLVQRPNDFGNRQFLRTYLYKVSTSALGAVDGNTVAFDPEFSNLIDGQDALKLNNPSENAGLLSNGKILSIEARKPVLNTDTIFYSINNLRTEEYQFKFVAENMLETGLTAYLADNYLHVQTRVILGDTSTVNFSVTADAGSFAVDRFCLVFRQLVIVPVTITHISATRTSEKNITVDWNVANETSVERYEIESSADGRSFSRLSSALPKLNNGGSAGYVFMDEHPFQADNYYRIKLLNNSGQVQYSAIVKVAAVKEPSSISIYPNPIVNKVLSVSFINQDFGNYHLQLSNKLGQVLFNKILVVTQGSFTESISLGNEFASGNYQLSIIAENGRKVVKAVVVN